MRPSSGIDTLTNAKFHTASCISVCYNVYWFAPTCLFHWDKTDEVYSSDGRGSRIYWFWYFSVFLITGCIGTGSLGFTVLFAAKFDKNNVVFCSAMFPIGCYFILSSALAEKNLSTILEGFEKMRTTCDQLISMVPIEDRPYLLQQKLWGYIGLVLKMIIHVLRVLSFASTPFAIYYNLDPFYNVYNTIVHPLVCCEASCPTLDLFSEIIFHILGLWCMVEAVRTYSICLTMLFYWLEMLTKCIQILRTMNVATFMVWYPRVKVAVKILEAVISSLLRVLLGAFFFVIVTCTVGGIKFVGKIPLAVYWVIPFCAFRDAFAVTLIFPFVTRCKEETEELLRRIAYENRVISGGSDRKEKLNRKLLAGMKEISLKCGGSFVLKRHTKSTFYQTIVERVVDGILLG